MKRTPSDDSQQPIHWSLLNAQFEALQTQAYCLDASAKPLLSRLSFFLVYGCTQADVVANVIALELKMALSHMLVSTVRTIEDRINKLSETKLTWYNALPKLIGFVGYIAAFVTRLAMQFSVEFVSLVVHVCLRIVSSIFGAVTAPINLAFNAWANAKTPFQNLSLVAGSVSAVAAATLWLGLATGSMTSAVLGTTALAASLIAIAWPLAIGCSVAAGVLLGGAGLYKLCEGEETAESKSSHHSLGQ